MNMNKVRTRAMRLLLRLCRISLTVDEIDRRQCTAPEEAMPKGLDEASDVDGVLDLARGEYEFAEKRRDNLQFKASVMFALVAGIGAILPAVLPESRRGVVVVLAVLAYAATIAILVHLIGIGSHMQPAVDAATLAKAGTERTRDIIRSYLQSASANNLSIDYLVDVYRAAQRAFLAGLLLTVTALFVGDLAMSLRDLFDGVLVACAIAGVVIGALGLRTWQAQVRGETRHKVARRLLKTVYRLREAIRAARAPTIGQAEVVAAVPRPDASSRPGTEVSASDVEGLVLWARFRDVGLARADLDGKMLAAEAIWGAEVGRVLAPLESAVRELESGLGAYLALRRMPPTGDSETDARLRSQIDGFRPQVYSSQAGPDGDVYWKKLEAAVAQAEAFARQHLVGE
jgi:hypothetical protein